MSATSRPHPLPGATVARTIRERKIVSPYPYKTAEEHYEALLAAAQAKGGPTVYTKATTPDWDGYYARDQRNRSWRGVDLGNGVNQVPTILSLLTPEYQKRMVQMNYHEAVDNRRSGKLSSVIRKDSCAGGRRPPKVEISSSR